MTSENQYSKNSKHFSLYEFRFVIIKLSQGSVINSILRSDNCCRNCISLDDKIIVIHSQACSDIQSSPCMY